MTRDDEMQQSLDRAHARLLDLIAHPEQITDLPDAEGGLVTSKLSDEEMACLARQVRLRQGGDDG